MLKRVLELLLVLVAIQLIMAPLTYAYLDPGTGSFVWQFLLASLVGSLFLLKTFWGRITSAVSRMFKSRDR